jgi:hypothetical protein
MALEDLVSPAGTARRVVRLDLVFLTEQSAYMRHGRILFAAPIILGKVFNAKMRDPFLILLLQFVLPA